jgi:hypothetical protein
MPTTRVAKHKASDSQGEAPAVGEASVSRRKRKAESQSEVPTVGETSVSRASKRKASQSEAPTVGEVSILCAAKCKADSQSEAPTVGDASTSHAAKGKAPEVAVCQSNVAIRIPSVDEIVQDQAHYVNICDEQSAVFREHVQEFKEAYAVYSKSADIAKRGQKWEPADCDRDAFVAEMKRRCEVVPTSIAE